MSAQAVHAKYNPDRAVCEKARVLATSEVARDTMRMEVAAPEIAKRILPGQFFMIRVTGLVDPLIGRPFALYERIDGPDGQPQSLSFLYLVKGKMSRQLARLPVGAEVELWGPLGNGFDPPDVERLILVAGGIGQTPFLSVAREALGKQSFGDDRAAKTRVGQTFLCYGARSADYLAGVEDFDATGVDLRIRTNDGSRGASGFVTEDLEALLKESSAPTLVYCCGPEAMMHRTSEICRSYGVPCRASLETPMACGIGICFTCVARVKQDDGSWDWKRTCVEGPVFDAATLVW
ncbi:MAG TPA: dihydroorotate dehydrogenase electron transfer subunit [Pirellulaceae bacterium]|jgi:dihydroorotate dehydrogenase electron transfer subunit|nr:dihydroorotate dehydrogenase electron transfer subunit [Pirellulaceae bacterium]